MEESGVSVPFTGGANLASRARLIDAADLTSLEAIFSHAPHSLNLVLFPASSQHNSLTA